MLAGTTSFTLNTLQAAPPTPTPATTRPTTAPSTQPAHEGLFRQLIVDLKLTENQRKELKAIIVPFHEKMAAWRETHKAQLQKLREEFRAAREAKDHDKVLAVAKEFRTLWETAPHVKDILPEIKKVLTPEQVDLVKERLEKWREEHAGALREFIEHQRAHAPATQPTPNKH